MQQADKIGALVERRNNPFRQNGLKWAKKFFGGMVRDAHGIFILPKKIEVSIE